MGDDSHRKDGRCRFSFVRRTNRPLRHEASEFVGLRNDLFDNINARSCAELSARMLHGRRPFSRLEAVIPDYGRLGNETGVHDPVHLRRCDRRNPNGPRRTVGRHEGVSGAYLRNDGYQNSAWLTLGRITIRSSCKQCSIRTRCVGVSSGLMKRNERDSVPDTPPTYCTLILTERR